MTRPIWRLTQRRSVKGLRKWCAFVEDGESPLVPESRLLPVIRDWGRQELDFWHRRFEARPDLVTGGPENWWMAPGGDAWRSMLRAHTPIWIRYAVDGGSANRTVKGSLGVWSIADVDLTADHLSFSLTDKIAEVR